MVRLRIGAAAWRAAAGGVLSVVLAASSAGCSAPESGGAAGAADSAEPSASPEGYLPVEFEAGDGEPLQGRLFGDGELGVVLSHMGRSQDGPDDWQRFAESLADQGVLVLTYTERMANSGVWQDVLGGVAYLREQGATTVVAAGASLGAMASLDAAGRSGSGINAVLWLAGVLDNSGYSFEESDVRRLDCPMLIASGTDDAYDAAPDARRLHEWTESFSELLIVDSRYHGTDILSEEAPEVADELQAAMTGFVASVADDEPAECREV